MAELDAARDELVAALGADAVLHDPLALRLYARDASMVEGSAGLVVFVRSAEDVVVCMQVAARHDLPVVPRGSGTGLAGGATPLADAIVVVTAKMNRMLEVRPEDRLAWVEPGVFNLDLGNALRPTGFTDHGSGVVAAGLGVLDSGNVRGGRAFVHARYPADAGAGPAVEVRRPPAGVEAQTREVEAAAREHGVGTIRIAADESERALLWKGRKSAFGAIARIAPHYHLHDCVVPRKALAGVLSGVYAIAQRHDLIVTNVFHAGDGNLHPLFSFDRSVPGTLERVLAASDELVRLCVDAGGSLSGEHGIGLEKRDFMPLVFPAEDLDAQACPRTAFDPDGRMNPRKVLPDGARCGDYAAAALGRNGALPVGTWI